jgi:hypothetical protein
LSIAYRLLHIRNAWYIHRSNKSIIVVLPILVLTLLYGCGKRHPPLPPLERIPQRTEALHGFQRGNHIHLIWPAPQRNASSNSLYSISRVDVYRLAESPQSPLPLTEEQFASMSTLIGSVPKETINKAIDKLTYVDTLELTNVPVRLRYALRYVNEAGQRAAFSNFLLVEPSTRLAMPPILTLPTYTAESIRIEWQPPSSNIDGSSPPNILGYNVYRVLNEQTLSDAINPAPITNTHFEDKQFSFGEKSTYMVRTVSLGSGGLPAESLDSNVVGIIPKDTFPPSPPEGITINASPRNISIYFAANSEPDIAGYHIYRSFNPADKDWSKLTDTLLTRTTFTDTTVEPGKKYYYYIVAVDQAGNTSQPSNIVSEQIMP